MVGQQGSLNVRSILARTTPQIEKAGHFEFRVPSLYHVIDEINQDGNQV